MFLPMPQAFQSSLSSVCPADLLATVPGFYAALAATLCELQERLQPGLPAKPNQNGWALPAAICERFLCDRSAPGQLCSECQPVAVSAAWLLRLLVMCARGHADSE